MKSIFRSTSGVVDNCDQLCCLLADNIALRYATLSVHIQRNRQRFHRSRAIRPGWCNMSAVEVICSRLSSSHRYRSHGDCSQLVCQCLCTMVIVGR